MCHGPRHPLCSYENLKTRKPVTDSIASVWNYIHFQRLERKRNKFVKRRINLLLFLTLFLKLKIIYQYIGRKFPICLILTLFFPIEWVPVPVPMGREKTLLSHLEKQHAWPNLKNSVALHLLH